MPTLKIDTDVSAAQFESMAKAWSQARHADIDMPEKLTEPQLRHIFTVAMSFAPDDFAYAVLANLAEMDSVPMDVLRQLIETGDRGCIEAVCLRDDLNPDIRELCERVGTEHRRM